MAAFPDAGEYIGERPDGSIHLVNSAMDFHRRIYKSDNQCPDDVDRLFDLYRTAWRMKINRASADAVSAKLDGSTDLVDRIAEGFKNPESKEDFSKFVDRTYNLIAPNRDFLSD